MECVPFESAAIAAHPSLEDWLAEAPVVLATMIRRWGLTAVSAYTGGASSSTLRVTRSDGSPAVLKVAYPHPEGTWEGVGLQAFPAGTAPEVYEQDPWTWSLLMEEIDPGTSLASAAHTMDAAEALVLGGRLHHHLTSAPVPDTLPRLADAMREYGAQASSRLLAQRSDLDRLGVRMLVDTALEQLNELSVTGPQNSLLHGDFNPGNILDAGDGRWRVIDPKPLVGDPSYDLWPLVSQIAQPYLSPDPATRLAEQVSVAAVAAECDRDRAARWSFARTGLNVSWYLAAGDDDHARSEAAGLRAWATVVGC